MPYKTPFYNWHVQHTDVVDFAGWELPMRFTNIIEEHMAVRENVGIFDVSHMGRIHLRGSKVKEFMNLIVPRNVEAMKNGKAGYTYILNENGGFKDDVIVTLLKDDHIYLVCNASNREKIINWLNTHLKMAKHLFPEFDVKMEDVTFNSAMVAIQGPKSHKLMEKVFGISPKKWHAVYGEFEGYTVLLTGTGYTGEAGGEVILEINDKDELERISVKMWEELLKQGETLGVKPCGLGARDTLRMEAGYCLYGNDMDETITPREAALYFKPFADSTKDWFIGKEQVENQELTRKRIGFVLDGKGIPRHGYDVLDENGNKIGYVSSGTQSPLLKVGIGMAYVPLEYTEEGSKIYIQIHKKVVPATVKKFPLYDPEKYGAQRKA